MQQQGIHCGFKLKKSHGNITMTYDDMTMIEDISYDTQVTNIATARMPNGTGDFVSQLHTFENDNELILAIEDKQQSQLTVYPNPTSGIIHLTEDAKWSVKNAIGVVLKSGFSHTIDISELPVGLYFVTVGNHGHKIMKI